MARYATTPGIVQAIALVEGFTNGKSRPAVENNNPGNIRFWAAGMPTRYGFTVFPDLAAGWAALTKLVDDYTEGRYTGGVPPSLRQMFAVYAPGSDGNNPASYAQTVSQRTGIPVNVPIISASGGGVSIPSMPVPVVISDTGLPVPGPVPGSGWMRDWGFTDGTDTGVWAEEDGQMIGPVLAGVVGVAILFMILDRG